MSAAPCVRTSCAAGDEGRLICIRGGSYEGRLIECVQTFPIHAAQAELEGIKRNTSLFSFLYMPSLLQGVRGGSLYVCRPSPPMPHEHNSKESSEIVWFSRFPFLTLLLCFRG